MKQGARKVSTLNERKLTWGEIKALLEAAGVRDEDEIDRIDIAWGAPETLECVYDEDFGWRVVL